jgi:hypothetical protein
MERAGGFVNRRQLRRPFLPAPLPATNANDGRTPAAHRRERAGGIVNRRQLRRPFLLRSLNAIATSR